MPKRKTAEVAIETALSNEQAKRTPAKPKTPAATHKRASKKAMPAVPAAAPAPVVPVHEEVARLAYSYWEARGCQGGCPEDDWFRAEQELSRQVQ